MKFTTMLALMFAILLVYNPPMVSDAKADTKTMKEVKKDADISLVLNKFRESKRISDSLNKVILHNTIEIKKQQDLLLNN